MSNGYSGEFVLLTGFSYGANLYGRVSSQGSIFPVGDEVRITEESNRRITEDGAVRVTE